MHGSTLGGRALLSTSAPITFPSLNPNCQRFGALAFFVWNFRMRVGYYKSGGLEVTLTINEVAILGEDNRVTAIVDNDGTKAWIKLEADAEGYLRLGERRRNGTQSIRFRPPNSKSWPFFGAETVESWSSGPGVLFGHRPRMNIPLIVRDMNRGKPSPAVGPNHVDVNDAVKIINNFARANPDIEMTISKEGLLVVRLYIEFGQ